MKLFPRIVRVQSLSWERAKRKADRAFYFAENMPMYRLVLLVAGVCALLVWMKVN